MNVFRYKAVAATIAVMSLNAYRQETASVSPLSSNFTESAGLACLGIGRENASLARFNPVASGDNLSVIKDFEKDQPTFRNASTTNTLNFASALTCENS